jgi:membrane associated rhomboid family serine protease
MASSPLPDLVACYRHADRLTGAHCPRCGRPICPECRAPANLGGHCPTCQEEAGGGPRSRARPAAARGPRRVTPVVAGLAGLNIVVFALATTHPSWEFDYAQIPAAVAHGQSYRLITAAFIHENITHLVFNMVALLIMGPPIEQALGRRRFLVLFVLAALGGSVFSFLLGPVNVAGVGASGAIFGIFGAWFSLTRASRSDTGVIVLLITFLLAYSFYDTTIDWRAHVGGLITGAVVGAAYAVAARRTARQRAAVEAVVVVAMLGLLCTFVLFRSARI